MRYAMAVLLCLVTPFACSAQSSPASNRDPQAIMLLTQALSTAGGSVLDSLHDFQGTGTITYYWAGQQVKGSATVRGKGPGQFRLDAALPSGERSWTVNNGLGSLRNPDGSVSEIPYHNAVNLGGLTVPFTRVSATMHDAALSVSYVGLQQVEGQQFHDIKVQKRLTPEASSREESADIFLDPKTFAIVGIQDKTHPRQTMTVDIPHAVYFSDFRTVQGALVPFSVSEYVNNQRVWSLQLDNLEFNTGLTDADFQF